MAPANVSSTPGSSDHYLPWCSHGVRSDLQRLVVYRTKCDRIPECYYHRCFGRFSVSKHHIKKCRKRIFDFGSHFFVSAMKKIRKMVISWLVDPAMPTCQDLDFTGFSESFDTFARAIRVKLLKSCWNLVFRVLLDEEMWLEKKIIEKYWKILVEKILKISKNIFWEFSKIP